MKIFLLHVGTPTPLLEAELEIIRAHQDSGDEITIYHCTGALPTCLWNHHHHFARCLICKSKFKNALNSLIKRDGIFIKEIPNIEPKFKVGELQFRDILDICNFRFDGEKLGYGVASSLVSLYQDHGLDLSKMDVEVTREVNAAVHVYETLKIELTKCHYDLVYIFNGRPSNYLPAKLICDRLGLKYRTYDKNPTGDRYIIYEGRIPHSPAPKEEVDYINSNWHSLDKTLGARFFDTVNRGFKDFAREQQPNLLPNNFDKSKINVGIFNSSIDEYFAVDGYGATVYFPDENSGIWRILEYFEADHNYMFYIRVHPNLRRVGESNKQMKDLRQIDSRFENVQMIWAHDPVDSYELVVACDKILTFGSNIGVEATYLGKVSILAGYSKYFNFDCVYFAGSHDEVLELLSSNIIPKEQDAALKYGYWFLSQGVDYKYFVQTGTRSGLPAGKFEGSVIRPDFRALAIYLVWRGFCAMREPSLVISWLKRYCKKKFD